MSQNNQLNHSNANGEMFKATNISKPISFHGIPGSVTPDNIQIHAPQPYIPPAHNGFTIDNLQSPTPAPAPQPIQDGSNE